MSYYDVIRGIKLSYFGISPRIGITKEDMKHIFINSYGREETYWAIPKHFISIN